MKNYFTISELSHSTTADARGINNTPPISVCDNLLILISECLNPIRSLYGKPISVTSGYRCPELNKLVGGKPTSQHAYGQAADLVGANAEETKRIYDIAVELGVFDQVLFETNSKGSKWVHISHKAQGDRHQAIDNYRA